MSLLLMFAAAAHPTDNYVSMSSVTGAQIAQMCAADQPNNGRVTFDPCNSYILGVADILQLRRATCRPPSDAATLQTVVIARRYIKDHPEKWGSHPAFMIGDALLQAFPCRK
ncbi:hypothetical protein M2336_001899 [Sphingobium sp. B1D7B]|uniref:Rap1a/Tai family immunity protein n=1 Tax=Sphingobium sp. B1D7B TaxID=2940578 RepID=UPI00222462E2|nr:Rap1a/Tai family immunity protein [Sphingobium sp. B1D7B]MCW2405270.1 hypothetical protein [Sphingobium sp. B1D7B]